ncbi:MAG: NosD domain-containing protein [Promethearchaeota archaeon]
MRKNGKKKVIILVLGIIFAILNTSNRNFSEIQGNNDGSVEIRDKTKLKTPRISGAFTESFIHIDGNWSDALGKGWFSGDGSWGNPYVIENVTIDASNSPTGNGIFLNNSKNVYFIIKNCTIYNAADGIRLENTNNGTLLKNNCSNNNIGIRLYNNCVNNTISNNIINDTTGEGILLREQCNNNTIELNTVCGTYDFMIRIRNNCDNNTILGNTIISIQNAILVQDYSDNNYILENKITGCNIYIYNCTNNCISRNIINGGTGIGIVRNCNFTFASENIIKNSPGSGIRIEVSSNNNTIFNNSIVESGTEGIILGSNCNNNSIIMNYVYLSDQLSFHNFELEIQGTDNIIKKNVLVCNDDDFVLDMGINTILDVNYYLPAIPSLCVEVIEQSFSNTTFVITINISSGLGFDLWLQSIQMWWNGIAVPSNNITELGNGLYNISLTPKFVESGEDPILLNMTIESANHKDKYFELKLAVESETIEKPPPKQLKLNIINAVYTSEWFNFTVEVTNCSGDREVDVELSGTWNMGNLAEPDNITDNSDGTFDLTLEAILVPPGHPGIWLNLTATKLGYTPGELNTKIAVDPNAFIKGDGNGPPPPDDDDDDDDEEVDLLGPTLILIGITSAIGAAGVAIYLIRKKRLKFKREK